MTFKFNSQTLRQSLSQHIFSYNAYSLRREKFQTNTDSVYRPRSHRPFEKFPGPAAAKLDPSPLVHDVSNPSKTCDCSTKQTEYFVFDRELVIPEYLVEFEYVQTVS